MADDGVISSLFLSISAPSKLFDLLHQELEEDNDNLMLMTFANNNHKKIDKMTIYKTPFNTLISYRHSNLAPFHD